MHKRARAHVRAAEKYMHDDKRKAIAHFGRAMHYFGASCDATGVAPKATDKVLGFIVTLKDSDDKYTRVADWRAELHVRERSSKIDTDI